MDWKAFFKPTWLKLLLCVVLFVVFVPFIEPHGFVCVRAPCPQPWPQSLVTQFVFLRNPIAGIHYLTLVVGAVLAYILACGAVIGSERLRKK
jgi:hypothetical protein